MPWKGWWKCRTLIVAAWRSEWSALCGGFKLWFPVGTGSGKTYTMEGYQYRAQADSPQAAAQSPVACFFLFIKMTLSLKFLKFCFLATWNTRNACPNAGHMTGTFCWLRVCWRCVLMRLHPSAWVWHLPDRSLISSEHDWRMDGVSFSVPKLVVQVLTFATSNSIFGHDGETLRGFSLSLKDWIEERRRSSV